MVKTQLLPLLGASVSYLLALCLFYLHLYLSSDILPEAAYPIGGCLFCQNGNFLSADDLGLILEFFWGFHFIRRIYEVLFYHDYRRTRPAIEVLGIVYYAGFALWFGWSLRNPPYDYQDCCSPRPSVVVLGVLIFSVGEIGNFICHRMLYQLSTKRDLPIEIIGSRLTKSLSAFSPPLSPPFQVVAPPEQEQEELLPPQQESKHLIPRGFLFDYISCPHYFFEMLTWLGYIILSWTLVSVLFFVATCIVLIDRAAKAHKRYLTEFDGQEGRESYPQNRKALIPFLF